MAATWFQIVTPPLMGAVIPVLLRYWRGISDAGSPGGVAGAARSGVNRIQWRETIMKVALSCALGIGAAWMFALTNVHVAWVVLVGFLAAVGTIPAIEGIIARVTNTVRGMLLDETGAENQKKISLTPSPSWVRWLHRLSLTDVSDEEIERYARLWMERGQPASTALGPLGTFCFGFGLLALGALLPYLLLSIWPESDPQGGGVGRTSNLFGITVTLSPNARMIFLVVVAGALGSLIHTATSFAVYVGNRRFERSWAWWYVLRFPIGTALALLLYFVLGGGMLGSGAIDVASTINPFAAAAVASLAGIFSKQATEKLRDVASTLWSTKEDEDRVTSRGSAEKNLQERTKRTSGQESASLVPAYEDVSAQEDSLAHSRLGHFESYNAFSNDRPAPVKVSGTNGEEGSCGADGFAHSSSSRNEQADDPKSDSANLISSDVPMLRESLTPRRQPEMKTHREKPQRDRSTVHTTVSRNRRRKRRPGRR